jgi:uncharacterized protein
MERKVNGQTTDTILQQKVSIPSEGQTLAGVLWLPASWTVGQRLPAVIVQGPWTQVKEQVQYAYAKKLAAEGFAVLSFDFRFWGQSGGTPRHWESTAEKVKDLLNAIRYLKTHPAVDAANISLLGVCAGAGIIFKAAALSGGVRSAATVAAWLQHPSTTPLFYGGEDGVQQRIALSEAALKKYAHTGTLDYVEAYNPNDPAAAMFFPLDYYGNPTRGRIPQWDNRFAVMSWKEWLTLNVIDGVAEKVNYPVIMVHSDGSALPDNVKKFYSLVPSKQKKLVWLEGEHTQFYDHDEQVDAALAEIVPFFRSAQQGQSKE